jgi:glycosyltransferase involved in cell wall biosynthesis
VTIFWSCAALAEIARNDQHPRRTLIIAENVSAPADGRVWSIATTLWRAHYEVSIICSKRRSAEASEETIDGVHMFRHPVPFKAQTFLGRLFKVPIALFFEFLLSIKVARRFGFDVIQICNPPAIIFMIGAFYKTFARKIVLFDDRDASPTPAGEKASDRGSFMERFAFKKADLSFTINATDRQIAMKRDGVAAGRVIVLRPCPDLDRIMPKRPVPLLRNGRTYVVAYAGTVSRADGLELFVQTMEYIIHAQQRADIQFVIVGGGPEWHEIAGLYGKMDLNEYVTFTGEVDDETLCAILSTADVCVDPKSVTSPSAANTGQKIMEYMAIGKPIVQFDTAEGRLLAQEASRYAQDNNPIDFAHQILDLLDSPEKRKLMGEFGQQRVRKELSWQREQQKLLHAYDALFAARAQRLARSKEKKGRKK